MTSATSSWTRLTTPLPIHIRSVLSYFAPEFTLGLTATPERADDKNILEIFKNTAHKLDIQTAVEIGELVPVRCIRIHTNIDLTKGCFNSVQYNIRDLRAKSMCRSATSPL